MKKTQTPFLTPVALALLSALGLSACGKNMNLKLNGAAATAGGGKPDKPINGDQKNDQDKKGAQGATGGTGDIDPKKTDGNGGDKKKEAAYPNLDGKYEPLSVFDVKKDPTLATGNPYPYLNQIKDEKGNLVASDPRHVGDEGDSVIARNNLVFRAIRHIPKKEHVKSIDKFELVFNGVRLYNAKGVERNTLAKQILCILDTRICSGEKDASDASNVNNDFFNKATIVSEEFSKLSVPNALQKNQDGSVIMASDRLVLDAKKALGLDKLKTVGEQMDWIEKNSTPFTDPKNEKLGYRKFRFVIANNLYVESGELDIVFILNDDGVKAMADSNNRPTSDADYANGTDDLKDGSVKTVPVKAETEKKKPDSDADGVTGTEDPNKTKEPVKEPVKTLKTEGVNTSETQKIVVPAPIVNPVVTSKKPVTEEEIDNKKKKVDISLDLFQKVVKFDINASKMDGKGARKVAETAKLLAKNRANIRTLYITGHASKTGSDKANLKLSDKRAKFVRQVLEKKENGMKGLGLIDSAVGLGEPKKSTCHPDQECEADRKVMIKISLKDSIKKDPVTLQQVRDNLIDELKKIWEADTEVSGDKK